MIYSYYIWLIVIGIFVYIITVDSNVLSYLILWIKMIGIQIQRIFWMIRLHPKNPITNLIKKYEFEKLAKEFESKSKQEKQ